MRITDAGHEETEEILEQIQRQVEGVYAEAAIDTQEKLDKYLAGFARRDKEKQALVAAGKMTQEEYEKWRYGQICVGDRWHDMVDVLTMDYVNADKIATSVIAGHLPEVYAINANYGMYQIEHGLGVNLGWTLYDRHTVERLIRETPGLLPKPRVDIPKDRRWNKQHIVGEITQGILQGEPVSDVAKRLQRVTDMDRNAALRNARTAVTGAQNAGRLDSYRRAAEMGIKGKKEWLASHDGLTRESHAEIDGEQVDIDAVFSNGLEYPGDPGGPPEEVYNCRCTMIFASAALGQVKDDPNYKPSQYEQDLMAYRKDKAAHKMSFDEWQKAREAKPKSSTSIGELKRPMRPRKADFKDESAYLAARNVYREDLAKYEESISRIIESTVESGGIKTYDDLMAWAGKNGIEISQDALDSISLRSFSAARPALDEMFSRFPEVKSFTFESFDGKRFSADFVLGTTKDGLLSAGSGVSFNPLYFSKQSEDLGFKEAFEGMADGFLVYGDGSFSTLVRHEYGHNAQNYIESKLADKYHQHVDDWRVNFATFDEYMTARNKYWDEWHAYKSELNALAGLDGSSNYSNTNECELFAEGFAEWASEGTSEFAIAFGKFFERWY